MTRRFGQQTPEELEEARRIAARQIERYGDWQDEATWNRFREKGIWNDNAAVQAALQVIMDRNDESRRLLLNRPRPMEQAPKDGTLILGHCKHEANPYFLADGRGLTPYGAQCEGLTPVPDGWHVLVWGGADTDYDEFQGRTILYSPWWFRSGSDFEEPANPVEWLPIPTE